jgi:hypothetical protein
LKNIDDSGLLTQLGYGDSEAAVEQFEAIKQNTKNFDSIKDHILALHDNIKPNGGFVALSSTNSYLKIKNPSNSADVQEYIKKWADKYKVELKKVEGKETYYIIGRE